jgi:hypothetical protein
MYCSDKCRDSDRSSAHIGKCDQQKSFPESPATFKLCEYTSPDAGNLVYTAGMGVVRLIEVIGLDTIKKTVLLENKPMESLNGDSRTRGFQDGKFQTATLEALLSLEDNLDKSSSEELLAAFQVYLKKLITQS